MSTRTWLTTPVGGAPADDAAADERWSPGPEVPVEPRVPNRFRGAIVMAAVMVLTTGLTFLIAPMVITDFDPTAGSEQGGTIEPPDADG